MGEVKSNYDLQVDMARKIFLEYDQAVLIRKYDLHCDDLWIYLDYLHTPCRIHRKDGRIEEKLNDSWQECRNYSTVMTVYDLLCYHEGENCPMLSGQWCSVGNFVVTGITDTEPYTQKIAGKLDGHTNALKAACQQLGGVLQPSVAGADITCRFPVTDFFRCFCNFGKAMRNFHRSCCFCGIGMRIASCILKPHSIYRAIYCSDCGTAWRV